MARGIGNISLQPMPGDVVELREADGAEVMLRVMAFVEDHVVFKEYGKGRFVVHLRVWQERLNSARVAKVIRPGDACLPF
jgi:hypothetical protein